MAGRPPPNAAMPTLPTLPSLPQTIQPQRPPPTMPPHGVGVPVVMPPHGVGVSVGGVGMPQQITTPVGAQPGPMMYHPHANVTGGTPVGVNLGSGIALRKAVPHVPAQQKPVQKPPVNEPIMLRAQLPQHTTATPQTHDL
jgi:hypothetical protein